MAKLSTASIRLVQKLNRQNKQGEYPIYIVVSYKGRVERKTGVSCPLRNWDSKRELIKGGANAPILNKMLSDIKNEVIDRRNHLDYSGLAYTARTLLESVKENVSDTSFSVIVNRLITERRLADKTARKYEYTARKLKEFYGREILVEEITSTSMKDFARFMEKTCKDNTIKSILANIASVCHFAIDRKLVDFEYPFKDFKYHYRYKEACRDYFLEKSHIQRLKEYFLDMVVDINGRRWTYKDGAYEKLHLRYTKEFGILLFLMAYRMNGSAPVDVGMVKCENCRRIRIEGKEYYAIDIKRKKTNRDVHIRLKRDLLTIISLEHFLGNGEFVYPICTLGTYKQQLEQCHKAAVNSIKWVREAFKDINGDIARDNAEKGLKEPQIDCRRLEFYTVRHSFSQHYLTSPTASIGGLASLLARSPNTIATYVAQITRDEDIAKEVENIAI